MSLDDGLFLGRLVFLAVLYAFLFILVRGARREMIEAPAQPGDRAPGDLVVLDAVECYLLQRGDRFPLLAQSAIGRSPGNLIVLDDPSVSGYHAELRWNAHGWVVSDEGSTNGTRVNGNCVENAAPIDFGDLLTIGDVRLRLERRRRWWQWWR